MKQKQKLLMGIDPDLKQSGYAIFDPNTRQLIDYGHKTFWDLINCIEQHKDIATIIIEGGWLIKKHNWHKSSNQQTAEKIAYNVGQNHCIGQLIEGYCKRNNIEHLVVKPKGKFDRRLFTKITGIQDKINQDVMDAVMLVYQSN